MTGDKQAPEPMRCHTCKHYKVDASMTDYDLRNQMGECTDKLGDGVEIRCDSQGCGVDEVLVDALFGCRGWGSADE